MKITIFLALTLAAFYVIQAERLPAKDVQKLALEQEKVNPKDVYKLALKQEKANPKDVRKPSQLGRPKRPTCIPLECVASCLQKRMFGLCTKGKCVCYPQYPQKCEKAIV